MADFTPTQGRAAESEIASALCVSPPSVNQMVKALEKKGLILRQPGQRRSLQVLAPVDEIPPWGNRRPAGRSANKNSRRDRPPPPPASAPAKLYVFTIFLVGGPLAAKYANKEVSRVIEIRGDQTLEQLHQARSGAPL